MEKKILDVIEGWFTENRPEVQLDRSGKCRVCGSDEAHDSIDQRVKRLVAMADAMGLTVTNRPK